MLRELHIKNLAIIREVALEFKREFTVLTGETGAGKSILIDGLNLVLGERADKELIRSGCEEASVSALFETAGLKGVDGLLRSMELEPAGGELLLRRTINKAGRSRCSVNGAPVPLSMLKKLGDVLVDLHGQHEHQSLLLAASHVDYLDAFGDLLGLRRAVGEAFAEWSELNEELTKLSAAEKGKADRMDLLNFQIKEIETARLKEGEEAELAAEKLRLANIQKLLDGLSRAHESIAGEGGAHEIIGGAAAALRAVLEYDRAHIEAHAEILSRLHESVADEGSELRLLLESLEADPARLEAIEERLDAVNRLKRKYGGSIGETLKHLEKALAEASELSLTEGHLAELTTKSEEARCRLAGAAGGLSEGRKEKAESFAKRVTKELHQLAMETAEFSVGITRYADPEGPIEIGGERCRVTPDGADLIEFNLAPNVGEGAKPLAAIASGGEVSRVMLALKSILASVDRVGTLVFDEIDSGIGGRVAEVVGRKLKEIGSSRQVICITHLPQIAAAAGSHMFVTKTAAKGSTRVEVKNVEGDARVKELARMLAGEEITETAVQHAQALLAGETEA